MGLLTYFGGLLGDKGTRTYEEGVAAGRVEGWEMVLEAISGDGEKPNDYKGPRPPELVVWVQDRQKRVHAIKETGR